MNSDSNTTIHSLKKQLRQFRDKRNWGQFHDPKNLAEAIAVEASELLEHFLWIDRTDAVKKLRDDRKFRKLVEDELADIICFSLNFANATEIDVARAVVRK